MSDMENRKFEDSFQAAFKEAEVNPSEQVWTNIELDLEKAEGDKMKRRLVFFKMLAAASVAFALCVAGIGYYLLNGTNQPANLAERTDVRNEILPNQTDVNEPSDPSSNAVTEQNKSSVKDDVPSTSENQSQDESIAQLQPKELRSSTENKLGKEKDATISDDNGTASAKAARQSGNELITSGDNKKVDGTQNNSRSSSELSSEKPSVNNSYATDNSKNTSEITGPSIAVGLTGQEGKPNSTPGKHDITRPLPAFYEPKEPVLELPVSKADPGMLLLAKLDEEAKRYAEEDKKEHKNKSEKLWTSVGFAAGGFDANNPTVNPPQTFGLAASNAAANTATKQSKASGLAYSIGVSMGTKLSERWVLQGGVNYLTQSSDYTANSVVVVGNDYSSLKAESLNAFSPQLTDAPADTKVAQTYPYNVNNNVRFVSVPVQAGYLIINKKFGLQVNAGVSTDLFLQNTITPDGGGLTKSTVGRGAESPYRSLNFSGLMGTELSYKLGYRYRLSLNPGLRYPFNSIFKSDTGVEANPLTFDVGLRFRYIFH
jgi:hypothetical protein